MALTQPPWAPVLDVERLMPSSLDFAAYRLDVSASEVDALRVVDERAIGARCGRPPVAASTRPPLIAAAKPC